MKFPMTTSDGRRVRLASAYLEHFGGGHLEGNVASIADAVLLELPKRAAKLFGDHRGLYVEPLGLPEPLFAGLSDGPVELPVALFFCLLESDQLVAGGGDYPVEGSSVVAVLSAGSIYEPITDVIEGCLPAIDWRKHATDWWF
ncbi:hypothetical protein [Botrimarina hoheduenensis]|uniref:Uncharacterized protein n=1 Tax=Botrimarina hoheduenensis TaxID=2528000 RepID=A0A5C5VSC0_9BACT|nr:hypothetical protein [Botrimarina hoheduenensis]TWT41514.1 hypothetical protein Pla111_28900 [Botrimarina hoheduenensis]